MVVSLVGQGCSLSGILIGLCYHNKSDTESAKGSRRQLKDAIYSTLFDMNVPAVCAINQVFNQLVHEEHLFNSEFETKLYHPCLGHITTNKAHQDFQKHRIVKCLSIC